MRKTCDSVKMVVGIFQLANEMLMFSVDSAMKCVHVFFKFPILHRPTWEKHSNTSGSKI